MDRYIQRTVLIDISSSTTVSESTDISGYRVVGVQIPASWTAGNITFQVDPNGAGTFYAVDKLDGNALTLTDPGASNIGLIDDTYFLVGKAIKAVAASAQAGDRTLVLLCVAL